MDLRRNKSTFGIRTDFFFPVFNSFIENRSFKSEVFKFKTSEILRPVAKEVSKASRLEGVKAAKRCLNSSLGVKSDLKNVTSSLQSEKSKLMLFTGQISRNFYLKLSKGGVSHLR